MPAILIIFLAFLSTACSPPSKPTNYNPDPLPKTIDKSLEGHVKQFEDQYGAKINFTVAYDSIQATGGNQGQGMTVGVCRIWSNGAREVLINQSYWESANSTAKVILMYHELGHCSFNRDHDTRTFNNGAPYSIMSPILNPVVNWYNQNPSYYLTELSNPVGPLVANNGVPWTTTSAVVIFEDHLLIDGSCENLERVIDP